MNLSAKAIGELAGDAIFAALELGLASDGAKIAVWAREVDDGRPRPEKLLVAVDVVYGLELPLCTIFCVAVRASVAKEAIHEIGRVLETRCKAERILVVEPGTA